MALQSQKTACYACPPYRPQAKEGTMATLSPAIQQVAERLQGLTLQEKRVLAMRFALDGQGNRTLADVAAGLQLTADEARHVEQGALLTLASAEAGGSC